MGVMGAGMGGEERGGEGRPVAQRPAPIRLSHSPGSIAGCVPTVSVKISTFAKKAQCMGQCSWTTQPSAEDQEPLGVV